MNRTNICKNIVQSIKDYITDQVKLEPHRVEKHFVRRRKLSLLQVIIYLFFSLFKSFHVPESFTDQRRTGHAFFSGCFKTGTFQSQTVH